MGTTPVSKISWICPEDNPSPNSYYEIADIDKLENQKNHKQFGYARGTVYSGEIGKVLNVIFLVSLDENGVMLSSKKKSYLAAHPCPPCGGVGGEDKEDVYLVCNPIKRETIPIKK